MKAFEGKIIKLYLNSASGYITLTGRYIDMEDDFLVIENSFNKQIQYFSKYFIKYVEIVKQIGASSDEYDN